MSSTLNKYFSEHIYYFSVFIIISVVYITNGYASLATNDDWELSGILMAKGIYGTLFMSYSLSCTISHLYDFWPISQWYTFFEGSQDILLKAYSTLKAEYIEVIPYAVKSLSPAERVDKVCTKRTIGILGVVNYAKGSEVIKHLVQKTEHEDLDIHIVLIGEMSESAKSEKITEIVKDMQMPLIVLNLGVSSERVADYEKGHVLNDMSVESILDTLTQIQD